MTYLIKNTIGFIKTLPAIIKRDVLKSPILNYFNTNFDNNVLLSYITKPFRRGLDLSHTNIIEAVEIAKIFNKLGFNVDIVDYDYEGFVEHNKYNITFGFGEPFVRGFYGRKSGVTSIYYATGMSTITQNFNSLKRVEEFYNRKGVYLPSSARLYDKSWTIQSSLPDAIITLGNQTAKQSFEKISNKKIYNLNPSFIDLYDYKKIISSRNFTTAKKNFLWFASSGMIHKGLDLLLEIFSSQPSLHLHICAPLDDEPEFKNLYSKELELPNIHYYGFISLKSDTFKKIITECGAIVYPSCSEGGSPAVLNVCGNGGLIPLVSKEATIDTDEFGFVFNSLDINDIKNQIVKLSQMNEEELKRMSLLSGSSIRENFSINKFTENLTNIVSEVLIKNKV